MRAVLIPAAASIAAAALFASPAAAQIGGDAAAAANASGVMVHRGLGTGDGNKHDRPGHRRPGVVVVGGPWVSNEAWALYNNRSWEPESFNDWWHERPWRAYPRWMQANQQCDRMWWGGGVWRCSW